MKYCGNSSTSHNDNDNYNRNIHQKQSHNEYEQNQSDQYSVVKVDIVNEKQINQPHPTE